MIKFVILTSYYYKGGTPFTEFEADNTQDVLDELKSAWYRSGISEGEIELLVYLVKDDGEEIELFFGHCNMDDGELYYMFDVLDLDAEREKCYEFGLFFNDLDSDSFEIALDVLFDDNSPDRTIGATLYKLSKVYETLSNEEKETFSKSVLAKTLDVFNDSSKAQEMKKWLRSSEGKQYLVSNPVCEPAGRVLLKALEQES
jgi:hypothetical protein